MTDVTLFGESPFDAIRREDEQGEYWTGRDFSDLPGKPPMAGCEGYIYVIEFSNGTVKVGKASNLRRRVDRHRGVAESMGNKINRMWWSPLHGNYSENERVLIKFGIENAAKRIRSEYFEGCGFLRFVGAAQGLTFTPLDRERQRLLDEEKSAAWRAWRQRHESQVADTVVVSRAYFEAAEAWLSLTRGPNPDGSERRLGPVAGCALEEALPVVEELADLTGMSVGEVFEMSWLDLLEQVLNTKVGSTVLEWQAFALAHKRADITRPGWGLTEVPSDA